MFGIEHFQVFLLLTVCYQAQPRRLALDPSWNQVDPETITAVDWHPGDREFRVPAEAEGIMPSSHSLPAPAPSYLECPRCPHCQARMTLESVSPAPPGYQLRRFECEKCDRISTRLVPIDPMKMGEVLRYLLGELKPPK